MIRTLRAFAWLRWRLLANSVRSGQRRDSMEQISRALALMLPVVVAALSVGTVLMLVGLGLVAGRSMARGLVDGMRVMLVVRLSLGVLTGVIVAFALSSPAQSALTRYTRLLLLPVSRRLLHLTEVTSSLVDPWILIVIPGIFAFAVGFVVGGRADVGIVAAVAGLLFIASLVCMSSTIGFLVGWLFRSRRRSEMFTLVGVLAFSLISFAPLFFAGDVTDGRGRDLDAGSFAGVLPWLQALPSQLYGDAIRHAFDGRLQSVLLTLAALAMEVLVLFGLSSAVHARLVGSVDDRGPKRRAGPAGALPRLPFVSAPTSAVAAAQWATATRSVRGRLLILLPGPMLALMATAFRLLPGEAAWIVRSADEGYPLLAMGLLFSVYTLQAFTMNLFASDRDGLVRQFLAPVSDAELGRGKVLGCAFIFAAAAALCTVMVLLVSRGGSLALWLSTLLGSASVYLLLTPWMVWFSALFPVAADLSKTGSGGNPHPVPMLAGTALTALAAVPAAAILYGTGPLTGQPWLTLPVMAVWTAMCWVGVLPFITWTSRTIGLRRENLALVAQGR